MMLADTVTEHNDDFIDDHSCSSLVSSTIKNVIIIEDECEIIKQLVTQGTKNTKFITVQLMKSLITMMLAHTITKHNELLTPIGGVHLVSLLLKNV